MASGNYPIDRDSEDGIELQRAMDSIRRVQARTGFDDNQNDNAYADGGYSERLSIAIEMIKGVLGPHM
jgi:hypothetical protein